MEVLHAKARSCTAESMLDAKTRSMKGCGLDEACLNALWSFNVRKMWGKSEEKVRNFPYAWNWCKEKERLLKFHTLEKCKEFFVWFSRSDECVEKCEEIRCSQFHKCKMWANWRWAGEMWENPFLTLENVRKYSKSFLAINFNVRKMWGIFHMCWIWATETKYNSWGEFFSEFGFFFYHDRMSCSGDLELQCHVTETNFFCVPEVNWESVISLPSKVVSGSLLRLLKFLPVLTF